MKQLRFFALLATAALVSVSFNSCDLSDDDPDDNNGGKAEYSAPNGYGGTTTYYEGGNWEMLTKKSKTLSAFPKLDGEYESSTVSDGKEGGNAIDMVTITYEAPKDQLDAYVKILVENKFVVSTVSGFLYASKVENGFSFLFEYVDGSIIYNSTKFTKEEDYQNALESYQSSLENMGSVFVSWDDVLKDNEWLKEFPALTGTFDQCIVGEEGVTLMSDFSEDYCNAYKKQLIDAGFEDVSNLGLYYSKTIDGYQYLAQVVESLYINFKRFEVSE